VSVEVHILLARGDPQLPMPVLEREVLDRPDHQPADSTHAFTGSDHDPDHPRRALGAGRAE